MASTIPTVATADPENESKPAGALSKEEVMNKVLRKGDLVRIKKRYDFYWIMFHHCSSSLALGWICGNQWLFELFLNDHFPFLQARISSQDS
jgi:hypothetical protein